MTMQAITQQQYGEPQDVLRLGEIDKPKIKDDEVLVRVHAASLAAGDLLMMRGTPYVFRPIAFGTTKPKNPVPGLDLAGTVEAVGSKVTGFQPGDEVFGEATGTLAEYAIAKPNNIARKPASLSFEQAAAMPVSGQTALQAVRDVAKVQPGQKVLVTGASGGVGSFAVQIAKALGAEVTGVCSTGNVELVRSIGADHVIDYTKEDFAQGDERYDFILDNAGKQSLMELRSALVPKGTVIPNNGTGGGPWFGTLGRILRTVVTSPFVSQNLKIFV
ncbi:MAG: NAD(P)-dependent alcohol dehydrogenase, partial [Actinomycetota bacterium]